MPVTWPSKNSATSRSVPLRQACAPSVPGIAVNMGWIQATGTCSSNSLEEPAVSQGGYTPARFTEQPEHHPLMYEEQDNDGSDRKSTRLNSSHRCISYAVFCLKKKKIL